MTRQRISKVIQVKDFTKEVLEIEHRRCIDELATEKARLAIMEDAFQKGVAEFRVKHFEGPIAVQELEIFHKYLLQLKKEIQCQSTTVIRKVSELEQKKNALLEAYKEKRLLEVFHDKILHSETKEKNAVEQKEADFNAATKEIRR